MPIEDASVVWPEEASPYATIARIRAPPQPSWRIDQVDSIDDALVFSPEHGFVAHQSLGDVRRVRKPVYAALRGGGKSSGSGRKK